VIIAFTVYKFYYIPRSEAFNLLDTGIETNDCYEKTLDECGNYSNCGIATINGKKQCIFGDIEGPLFNLDTQFDQWTYTDKYSGQIFNESYPERNYDTWATFYPIYEVFYPSPTSLAALF
jgi:hypothetical protein